MEQTTLALRSTAQELRPYFQAHPMVVITDHPLRNILHKPGLIGRMLQWAIELSEYEIEYQLRLSMKWQVMADFVVEYYQKPAQDKGPREEEWWTLRVDVASRSSGSGVGLLLQSSTGEQLEQAIRLGFPVLNNEIEYEAILSGLDLALTLSVSKLQIYSDSQFVVKHVLEEYGAKDERMVRYLTKVRNALQRFGEWTIEKFPRTDNVRADALAGITYVQTDSSITEASTCNTIEESQGDDQELTEVIAKYLRIDSLLDEPRQAHKIWVQAARFTLIGGTFTSDPS